MQIGPGGVLFVVFLVLKLTLYIDWSWWWITAPLWGAFALTVLMLVVFGAGAALFMRQPKRQPLSRSARF